MLAEIFGAAQSIKPLHIGNIPQLTIFSLDLVYGVEFILTSSSSFTPQSHSWWPNLILLTLWIPTIFCIFLLFPPLQSESNTTFPEHYSAYSTGNIDYFPQSVLLLCI